MNYPNSRAPKKPSICNTFYIHQILQGNIKDGIARRQHNLKELKKGFSQAESGDNSLSRYFKCQQQQ